jgi:hypothetical protein
LHIKYSQEEKDEYKNQMDIINSLPPTPPEDNQSSIPLPPMVTDAKIDETVQFFDNLEVIVTPHLVSGAVYSFPIARSIFLRVSCLSIILKDFYILFLLLFLYLLGY